MAKIFVSYTLGSDFGNIILDTHIPREMDDITDMQRTIKKIHKRAMIDTRTCSVIWWQILGQEDPMLIQAKTANARLNKSDSLRKENQLGNPRNRIE